MALVANARLELSDTHSCSLNKFGYEQKGAENNYISEINGLAEFDGGSWANSNTTLKDLSVSGGTLTPSFTSGTSGNSYEYTLLISGKTANIKVTPTAANKNFLTKIFLNEKVTSNVQGSSNAKETIEKAIAELPAADKIKIGNYKNTRRLTGKPSVGFRTFLLFHRRNSSIL